MNKRQRPAAKTTNLSVDINMPIPTMTEPPFHSNPVQLPHLKLSLNVGSFVQLDNGAIGRIFQSNKKTVNNRKKQLVLFLYYTLVICPDKFDFELTAENNRQSFWFASSMIDSIVLCSLLGRLRLTFLPG